MFHNISKQHFLEDPVLKNGCTTSTYTYINRGTVDKQSIFFSVRMHVCIHCFRPSVLAPLASPNPWAIGRHPPACVYMHHTLLLDVYGEKICIWDILLSSVDRVCPSLNGPCLTDWLRAFGPISNFCRHDTAWISPSVRYQYGAICD